MTKRNFLGIVVIVALLVTVSWLRVPSGSGGLHDRIASTVARTPTNGSFKASALMDEPWELLFVFHAYLDEAYVSEVMGFEWTNADRVVVDLSEGEVALVFTTTDEVVSYTRFRRVTADFADLDPSAGYPYSTTFTKGPPSDPIGFPKIAVESNVSG